MIKKSIAALVCAAISLTSVLYLSPLHKISVKEHRGLHTIYGLNTEDSPLDSHSDATHLSILEGTSKTLTA